MTNQTFFFIFIPILAFILLAINLIFAIHNPYQEKDSAFECGFHSFLGQNRTQFTISFFIFALLFLIFDLEILLVYPYSVSGYSNGLYGLIFMLIFFVILTLGFIFEFGKNALKLDSKQKEYFINILYKSHIYFNLKLSSVCSHTTGNYCQICDIAERERFCIHQWMRLPKDIVEKGIGQTCDFAGDGPADKKHVAFVNGNSEVYICNKCNAISCANCCLESTINRTSTSSFSNSNISINNYNNNKTLVNILFFIIFSLVLLLSLLLMFTFNILTI